MPGTYIGSEQELIEAWILSRLTGTYAAALEAVSPGLSTRVFPDVAPPTAAYPFIVYQAQSPPRDIRGVGTTRVMVEAVYVVKAIAQVSNYMTLATVAKVIDLAMTLQDVVVFGTDGYINSSVRDAQYSLSSVEQGTQFRHLGGEYRIMAQAI